MTATTSLLIILALAAGALAGIIIARRTGRPAAPPTDEDQPALAISTGLREVDVATTALLDGFKKQIDTALDEVFETLSYAYPGLYANPNEEGETQVQFRVREPGTGRHVSIAGAAAIYAHRKGIEVQRRSVTTTDWVTEPNPTKMTPRPISPPPLMMPTEHPDHPTSYDPEAARLALSGTGRLGGVGTATLTGSHAVEVGQ